MTPKKLEDSDESPVKGGEKVPEVTNDAKDTDLLKDGSARLLLPADQQIEGENPKPKAHTSLRWVSSQKPLIFDEHLRQMNHD